MKNFLFKVLMTIVVIMMVLCGIIVMYAKDPDFASVVKMGADSIPRIESSQPEETGVAEASIEASN